MAARRGGASARWPAVLLALLIAACTGPAVLPRTTSGLERWAFTAPWDARSASSAHRHAALLNAVVLGWMPLDTIGGGPSDRYPDTVARSGPRANRRMAIVTNLVGASVHPGIIRSLARDSLALRRSALAIASRATREGYRGVVLDFGGMSAADSDATRLVVATIAQAIHRANAGPVVVAIPASDTVAYPARLFDGSADLLLVKLYDQHWPTSPPGTIASPDWVRRTLGMRVAERGASRLVAALPAYGYLWRPNALASTIGFEDAARLAAESGTALVRDPATSTLHAVRAGADGWELWVSDAGLLDALEREVVALGVRRVALWRLGLEDPAIWSAER